VFAAAAFGWMVLAIDRRVAALGRVSDEYLYPCWAWFTCEP